MRREQLSFPFEVPPFDPKRRTEVRMWRLFGLALGYPWCCVEAWIEMRLKGGTPRGLLVRGDMRFVPCAYHWEHPPEGFCRKEAAYALALLDN